MTAALREIRLYGALGRRFGRIHRLAVDSVAEAMRAQAVPGDHPMSVVWCSRPAEWELARFHYPGVDEVAVVGVPDADLGQRIVAFVVGDVEPARVIDFVAEQLSVHKRPREVRIVASLPRNAMGKVLKKELTK